MFKRIALVAALLTGRNAFSEIPKNPTRQQIIDSCIVDKVTVQERMAFQGCKTKLDAAQLLLSIYQDRLEKVSNEIRPPGITDEEAFHRGMREMRERNESLEEFSARKAPLLEAKKKLGMAQDEIAALIVTLKAPPAPKAKKKPKT